jgi:hypothetical protein
MPVSDDFPKCYDPYLRYAIATEFRTFEPFGDTKTRLFFLGEFKQPATKAVKKAFVDEMLSLARVDDIEYGPADEVTPYVTLRTKKNAVLVEHALAIWDRHFLRVALSLPLMSIQAGTLVDRSKLSLQSPGSLLIGVIDDGCPFAAAQFLESTGNTRVLSIWDQDQNRKVVRFPDSNGKQCDFGQVPFDFKYGLEYLRDSETVAAAAMLNKPRRLGLNEWIGLHMTPTGSLDEDGCYQDTDFKNLQTTRLLHGAHVMDVFGGNIPPSSRFGFAGLGRDRRDPPSWQVASDRASRADMVFVQFPESCIKDSTGVWLKAYVVDAVRYILSFADSKKIENVVINLSYGPTTGPHDGTAELEAALVAFVSEYDGINRAPKLDIVLAAGNSYLSESYVEFVGETTQPSTVEWVWRLSADNPVLCFSEVWMTAADAAGVKVKLTSPGGIVYGPTTASSVASVGGPYVWSTSKMWRLEVGPTIAKPKKGPAIVNPGSVAEHGDWKIKITGIRKGAEMHAYVARTDPNLGARTGAKRSIFVDPNWERTRAASAGCTRANGEFDKAASLIRRHGTLNGIATSQRQGVHVAGGFMLSNERKSPYSSAGPARSGPLPQRVGPDFALPCDESYALEGIRAGGARTGVVFRLIGTSAAAPQLARHLANFAPGNQPPTPTNPPTNRGEMEERGGGNLPPP